jgi:hypothetical protein
MVERLQVCLDERTWGDCLVWLRPPALELKLTGSGKGIW